MNVYIDNEEVVYKYRFCGNGPDRNVSISFKKTGSGKYEFLRCDYLLSSPYKLEDWNMLSEINIAINKKLDALNGKKFDPILSGLDVPKVLINNSEKIKIEDLKENILVNTDTKEKFDHVMKILRKYSEYDYTWDNRFNFYEGKTCLYIGSGRLSYCDSEYFIIKKNEKNYPDILSFEEFMEKYE